MRDLCLYVRSTLEFGTAKKSLLERIRSRRSDSAPFRDDEEEEDMVVERNQELWYRDRESLKVAMVRVKRTVDTRETSPSRLGGNSRS